MEKGIIISGFAGIGKTTIVKKYQGVIDLESSDFKWVYSNENIQNMDKEQRKGNSNRTLNTEWPLNYVKAIIDATSEYEIVLISQDQDMRNCLKENSTPYFACFPTKECKEDFIKRYKDRGNPETFISIVETNFDDWIDALMDEENKIIMEPGEYLENTLARYGMLPKTKKPGQI